jgi:hypothetical protein
MNASTKPIRQEAEKTNFLNRLSLRNKLIGAALLVFVVLLVISIPGDRDQLLARQERIEVAQVAYDLALPAVEPVMQGVITFIDETGVDVTGNRLYSGLSSALTTLNRANATVASRFQGVVTFSRNAHDLLEGSNAVPELDTDEFRLLIADMDTTMGVGLLALMELNDTIDEYNGYQNWISAKIASAIFSLPQGYTDPVPSNSRLNRESLTQ